jgi:hypothetical protein
MTTKTIIHWEADDPATPALLDPLFDDMGIGADDTLRPESREQKEKAREALKNYLTGIINNWGNATMGEINTLGYAFYDGYLAGLAGTTQPQRS